VIEQGPLDALDRQEVEPRNAAQQMRFPRSCRASRAAVIGGRTDENHLRRGPTSTWAVTSHVAATCEGALVQRTVVALRALHAVLVSAATSR
jgi:hypothetical protein